MLTAIRLITCGVQVGYALGYIFGGLVGGALGWRAAFWLEAAAAAPFALFCLLAPPVDIKGSGAKPAGVPFPHPLPQCFCDRTRIATTHSSIYILLSARWGD